MRSLYVVATPIGNLEDISLRALRILRKVDVIAAEDTRVARALLSHFEIHGKRLVSYNEHNRARRIPEIVALLEDHDVALVTDAGTPAVSDPGAELVAAARASGATVVPVPGASALVAALSVAGLRTASFTFVGFLPRATNELRDLLAGHAQRPEALVAFEAPQRLSKTLAVLAETLPARRLAVCRELTKLHEEVFVGTAAEALSHFPEPRGEVVLVIEGAAAQPMPNPPDVAGEVSQMKALGLTRAQAGALLEARHGLSRRQVYALWLKTDG
jgi:16S rRNA (cytidine1402-2'-O)-methyltransferase